MAESAGAEKMENKRGQEGEKRESDGREKDGERKRKGNGTGNGK